MNKVELLAPAGSFESLTAAIQGGADAVYFGAGHLNMRARSSVNFSPGDLVDIADICRQSRVKAYLTLNTVVYDSEAEDCKRMLNLARDCGLDAVIASDPAVIMHARSLGLQVHLSTQCNVANTSAVKFYSAWADVMVLARELSLTQVARIIQDIGQQNICGPSGNQVRIEVFGHGAMCMAVSGKCYLSLDHYRQSANRGSCLQLCRRGYLVTDLETGTQLEIDHQYIMSPKDLNTIGFLDRLSGTGISILKIEGRGRSADYVKTATCCYREALDALAEGSYNAERVAEWTQRLSRVFNRGFWDGYYLGRTMGEWSDSYGSKATMVKTFVGKVTNYFGRPGVAEITLESGELHPGDEILITGRTTGVMEAKVKEIRIDHSELGYARKGEVCSLPVKTLVRRGDQVYLLKPAKK